MSAAIANRLDAAASDVCWHCWVPSSVEDVMGYYKYHLFLEQDEVGDPLRLCLRHGCDYEECWQLIE